MNYRLISAALIVFFLFSSESNFFAAEKEKLILNLFEKNSPESKRVDQWAGMLAKEPRGLGAKIENRQAWESLGACEGFQKNLFHARKLLTKKMPDVPDELYLDFSRTGNRRRCEKVLSERANRFNTLVLAECVENRGEFLSAIEDAILSICGEKSWTLPAHDGELKVFSGKENNVDLRSAAVSWNLATASYWLGGKLKPETRKRIRDELERRTFDPFSKWLSTGKPSMRWVSGKNNWVAVCLAGVTGSAMASIESRDRRALFAAAAEKHIKSFLDGFTPDGYCSEGVGYWCYGFGHYIMLSETLRQATGGSVDMMLWPGVSKIAQYGKRVEILPGFFPSFADCSTSAKSDARIMAFLSRRFKWGLEDVESRGLTCGSGVPGSLFSLGIYCFPNSAVGVPPVKAENRRLPLHDWFPDAQVLVSRPSPGQENAMGVAMKGGHNAEQHNHNDLGSYVVVLDGGTPLVDPGNEIYTKRTFSVHRYDSKVLNSYGHAVPLVAGQLQQPGRQAAAKVINSSFGKTSDTLALDLTAAYKVKSLKKLTRTFVFSREGRGALTISDAVEFDSPQAFGTALATFDKWKQIDAKHVRVGDGASAVTVEVTVDGGDFQIAAEDIHEDLPGNRIPLRIGINLKKPAKRATIRLRIEPEG